MYTCIVFPLIRFPSYDLIQACQKVGQGLRNQQQEKAQAFSISDDHDDWDLLALPAVADDDAVDYEDSLFDSPASTPVPFLRGDIVSTAAVSVQPSGAAAAAAAVSRWAPIPMVHHDWGARHPEYGKPVKKATWTPAEKAWIQAWIQAHPDQVTGHSRCLKDIQADPDARGIFHSIHVLCGARLRAGFEAAMKCSVV
jgi:hypothetical protein